MVEQQELKRRQKEEEQYLEKAFREKMLERMAEQERIEQLSI